MSLSIYHTLTHTQLKCIAEEGEVVGAREKEAIIVGISSYCFWGISIGADSISEEVVGFYSLWFPRGKYLCSLYLVFYCCACYSLR